jgi:hypothetical protein
MHFSNFRYIASMRVFHCTACGNLVFFDSMHCMRCGHTLAFFPATGEMLSLTQMSASSDKNRWQAIDASFNEETQTDSDASQAQSTSLSLQYKLCAHRGPIGRCNFALAINDSDELCASCRQTRWLPDLSIPLNQRRWNLIESAKRQLYYTLRQLGLASTNQLLQPTFDLLEDMPGVPVFTGHTNGAITLNVAEADDEERTKRRIALQEPYRTLLGHLRHESGHFFWDVLVHHSRHIEDFRALFGDERTDYGLALERYYARDPLSDAWREHFISAYATAHPWEDWAESWAHYLHMVDLLESAASFGTTVTLPTSTPNVSSCTHFIRDPFQQQQPSFDEMVSEWVPLTLLTNSLNRSLGQGDAYPFALMPGAREKLRFVHTVVQEYRIRSAGIGVLN